MIETELTIIVCCYNSANRIEKTLLYLLKQTINVEIIVVDNASTDLSSKIVADFWSRNKSINKTCKIVLEPKPGLNNARQKGIEESSNEIIIFCDDDNWLYPNYSELALKKIKSNNCIGVLGGFGIPIWEILPNDNIIEFVLDYATGSQGNGFENISKEKGYCYGAGMVTLKKVIQEIESLSITNITTDRLKESLTSGGDNEFCYKARLLGYEIWYDEGLIFEHFIQKEKVSMQYLHKLHYAFGYSYGLIFPYEQKLKYVSKRKMNVFYQTLLLSIHTLSSYLNFISDKTNYKKFQKIRFSNALKSSIKNFSKINNLYKKLNSVKYINA